ncbi:GIY-YIG nuclease family protein [Patescibacteria group bacterium]
MNDKQYFVYILTNKRHTVLYVGFTSDLIGRIENHKCKIVKGFTNKYNINKLVYFEVIEDYNTALAREKQIKNWHREWKWGLVKKKNPDLKDLTKIINS